MSREHDIPEPPPIIGTAFMAEDGTIRLDLRAEMPGGRGHGISRLEYPRYHRQYEYILRHLGGMQPGESKPVRPFPAESSKETS